MTVRLSIIYQYFRFHISNGLRILLHVWTQQEIGLKNHWVRLMRHEMMEQIRHSMLCCALCLLISLPCDHIQPVSLALLLLLYVTDMSEM